MLTKILCVIGFLAIALTIGLAAWQIHRISRRQVPFEAGVWNQIDEFVYPREWCKMALWLIEHYDFIGKTSEEICKDLYNGDSGKMQQDWEGGTITMSLRNRIERFLFLEWYDEHVFVIDAQMRIELEGDVVKSVVIEEIKEHGWVVTQEV